MCGQSSVGYPIGILQTLGNAVRTQLAILTAVGSLLVSSSIFALSPDAEEGKKSYPVCDSCHNPELTPALGPPMFGVQRRYKRVTGSREDFIDRIAAFVTSPSDERVVMLNAAEQLGPMPAMPLPDDTLRKIASYIYEEAFHPPCVHWAYAIENGLQKGNKEHVEHDRRQYQRFCQ